MTNHPSFKNAERNKKISIAHKGKIITDEQRALISLKNKLAMARPEVKAKIKNTQFKLGFNKGKTYEEIYGERAKIIKLRHSLGRRGIPVTEETRMKNSKSHKGRTSPMKGKHHTEKTINKLRMLRFNQIIPSKDTKIELAMQNELNSRGIIYEKHKSILGQPDLFIKPDICIFADGDYWHNISRAKKRDPMINEELRNQGYLVLRYWEHEIKGNVVGCVDEIEEALFVQGVVPYANS